MDRLQLSGLPPLAWHTVGVRFIVARLIVSRAADMDESRSPPFVLKSRKPIPRHIPDPSRVFDPKRQLWILRDAGIPVVSKHARPNSRQPNDWAATTTPRTSDGVNSEARRVGHE